MLKPFYQGKLDTFCAIYAVLNAMRLIHGLRVLKARDILNETLLGLSATPAAFRAVLEQTTDYIALVDGMLNMQSKKYPMQVDRPFATQTPPDRDELWKVLRQWMDAGSGRTVIFRFLRNISPESGLVNRHWTTVDHIDESILHLFDCSHEAEAILNIRRDSFVTSPRHISQDRLLYIQPESVRLIRLPF